MNPVLQTFSDEYRELTLQKECVFRACLSSSALLPVQPSSTSTRGLYLFLSRTHVCVFSFCEWLNGLVWERKPFFPVCFISWCSHARQGLHKLCRICMLIKSFTSSLGHVPPGQRYKAKRELYCRVILSPHEPSFPATAVPEMLQLVSPQSRRSCSLSALTTLLIAARVC